MTALKTIFRRAKTLLWTAFSILVILAAVGVGVGKLLMPYSDRYQPRLESWLSAEFGRPVKLESFKGEWTAFGPRLSLQGMKLMPPTTPESVEGGMESQVGAVAIESAALDLSLFNLLLPNRALYNFRIIGADFELRHTTDGRFELSGFGVSGRGGNTQGSALKELARVGEVILQDSSLLYQDEKHGILLGFSGIQGALRMKGDELATEIQASFFDARSGLEYGEVDATMLLNIGEDQKMVSFDWQATARELMLAAFQGRLPKNSFIPLSGWLTAEFWGEWSRQDGHLIKGVFDLTEATLVNEYQDLQLDRINSRFRWQMKDKAQWSLDLADLLFDDGRQSWTTPRLAVARDKSAGVGLWISADQLPLDVPLTLARDIMAIYGTPWPAFLPGAAAGNVQDLDLILDSGWRLIMAEGSLSDASVLDWGRWPDLRGLQAQVSLRKGAGIVAVSSEQLDADWPRMFREPVRFSMPQCVVDLKWGDGWQTGINGCRLENDDLAVGGNLVFASDEGKPRVDVNVKLMRGRIDRLGLYLPEALFKDKVKAWLRKGLVGGDLVDGRFQIHGDMDDWPFREGKGRFEAMADIANGRLNYLDGWPEAAGLQARARFLGPSLTVSGSIGDIGGAEVQSVNGRIAELKSAVLELDYSADTGLPQILSLIQQTPLRETINTDLSEFTFSGAARTSGSMTVPISTSEDPLVLDGKVSVPDGFFSDPVSDITLENISGDLHYDATGFTANALDVRFRGYPARLDLAAGTGNEEKFRADLTGLFGVRDVIPGFLLDGYPDLAKVDGECLWNASLTVAPSAGSAENLTLLSVRSALAGVELNFPDPLHKPAGERWPLEFRFPISGDVQLLDVEFVNRATLRFDLSGDARSPLRSVIRLGAGLPEMPPEGLIRIEGSTEVFDLDGWVDLIVDSAAEGEGMGGLELERGAIRAGKMLFLDRYFDDVEMSFDVLETDVKAEFSATELDGSVRFTTGESGMSSLTAEFDRLALGDPVSSGVDTETNPADLPALHLYARSFKYSGVELGETRVEAYPTADGFHFEKVDAASSQLSVQARGDWSLGEQGQRSDFDINMTSESLGEFLTTMDISSSMQGGQTQVSFSAWWPGSPAAFALSRLNGRIEFDVTDGNITEASAGGGRLLGLLSFQALPKRLSLDFRDVFDAGFSFDQATGTFQLENGTATTDDMMLKSSAANILVSGSTNLVDQTYDQLLTIRPGLGNTLPIIGALAGGPVGAAAGLALQGLLQGEIAEASQVQYAITGDWDNPVFETVDVDRVEPPAPPKE
ncbi:MAG: TIGR02099 family protein [Xanthomonadales bacterium]|nr:TIGR02099 family protein [Gammaproteobacteria bacterium]NNK52622.1 TIGR02099 family protein [Xanthomonadales bacterium]